MRATERVPQWIWRYVSAHALRRAVAVRDRVLGRDGVAPLGRRWAGMPWNGAGRSGTAWQANRSSTGQGGIVWYLEGRGEPGCSGLLIRGFGVRVPGGAPVSTSLTCAFSNSEDARSSFRGRAGQGMGRDGEPASLAGIRWSVYPGAVDHRP